MAIQAEKDYRMIGKLRQTGQIAYFKSPKGKWVSPFAFAQDDVEKTEVHELKSEKMGVVIAEITVSTLKDKSKRYLVEYNKLMLATRPRPDGEIGIQTIFEEDTRTAKDKKDDPAVNMHKAQFGLPPLRTSSNEASWNNKSSLFRMEVKK